MGSWETAEREERDKGSQALALSSPLLPPVCRPSPIYSPRHTTRESSSIVCVVRLREILSFFLFFGF